MLDVKELFVKILQKFNKSLIVTQSYMTEAKDVSAAGYAILEATYTTKDGYDACMAHVIDTSNVRLLARSCYFTNNSKVKVYVYNPTSATITNGQVRVEVIYCLRRGGIKDSFSHLSGLLKSFAGRRWARYAESEEIADEVVREDRDKKRHCNFVVQNWFHTFPKNGRFGCLLVVERFHESCKWAIRYICDYPNRIQTGSRSDSISSEQSQQVYIDFIQPVRRTESIQLFDCHNKQRQRSILRGLVNGITPAPERGWWCA